MTIITKQDLLNALERVPADAEIRLAQPTHDYWRTRLAVSIRSVCQQFIRHTDYHNADAIEEEGDGNTKIVWVLDY